MARKNSYHISEEFERLSFEKLLLFLGYDDAIVLENACFKYPRRVITDNMDKEIKLINGPDEYEVDRIAFAWNTGEKAFDLIQASIKNRRFEEINPSQLNSAKLLGYSSVDLKYMKDMNLRLSKVQKLKRGEFEHIKDTTVYEFLEYFRLLSDIEVNAVIVKSKRKEGTGRANGNVKAKLISKDLELNGIDTYVYNNLTDGGSKKEEYTASKYIKNLKIPANDIALLDEVKFMLCSKGYLIGNMENYITNVYDNYRNIKA
ncbi:MAG: hypothetical protein U9O53_02005 [archaeon]|nr:hypothetical protein [archaeon]